jgi:hypothetical protein
MRTGLACPVMAKLRLAGSQTFVVRIVSDDGRHGSEHWRATVVDVGTGERRTIGSYADLEAFIEERRRREATHD